MTDVKGKENMIELKVILLGEMGVGKTNIILRYTQDKFDENTLTSIGSSYTNKVVKRNDKIFLLNIWDTAGQELFRSVTKLSLQNAQIVILVYSIIDEKSFKELDYWLHTAIEHTSENIIVAVVGNKKDLYLQEVVKDKDARNYAKKRNAIFNLISAKSDKLSIDGLFNDILDNYIQKNYEKKPTVPGTIKMTPSFKEKKNGEVGKKKNCC